MNAETMAASLSTTQRKALSSTNGNALSQSQSDRGSLTGPLTDYSFRPARLTPLGIDTRAALAQVKAS